MRASLVVQSVKNFPAMQETQVWSLSQEDPLEKKMATCSSILAWKINAQRNLVGYSPWGHKESDMTERLHFHFPPLYNELLKAECARTHSPKRKRGLRQTLGSPGRTRAQPGPPVGKRHRAALMRGKISEGRAPPGMRPLVASGQQWACSLGCWLWVKTCWTWSRKLWPWGQGNFQPSGWFSVWWRVRRWSWVGRHTFRMGGVARWA